MAGLEEPAARDTNNHGADDNAPWQAAPSTASRC
jgi:hypothetical protein